MCERNRSRLEIVDDILENARGGKIKTYIIYRSNLNNTNFVRYLDVQLGASLLEKRDRRYYTTEKGDSFLELMAKIKEMISLDTLA
jgi:predicted transcriptional regulator